MDIVQAVQSFRDQGDVYAAITEEAFRNILAAEPQKKAEIFFEYIAALARKLAETAYLNIAGHSESAIGEVHRVTITALAEGIIESLCDNGIVDDAFTKAALFAGGDAFHKKFMELDALATGSEGHVH